MRSEHRPSCGRGGWARVHSPSNSHTPVFDLLALDGEAAGELADAVLGLGGRRVDLSYLDPEEQAFAA